MYPLGQTIFGEEEKKMQLSPLKQFENGIKYGIYTSAQWRELQHFLIWQSCYTDPFKPRSEINSNPCTICALSATAVSRCNLRVDDNKPRFYQSTCTCIWPSCWMKRPTVTYFLFINKLTPCFTVTRNAKNAVKVPLSLISFDIELQHCRVNLSLLPIFDNLTTKISFHNFYFDEIISNINKIHENMY